MYVADCFLFKQNGTHILTWIPQRLCLKAIKTKIHINTETNVHQSIPDVPVLSLHENIIVFYIMYLHILST